MAKNKKRADGRYSCQVYLGKGPDGKRKYKTFYGSTLREARAAADDFRSAVSKGMDPEQAEATLGTLYDNLIAAKKAKRIGQKSIDRLATNKAHWGELVDVPASELRAADFQKVLNNLADWHDGKPPLSHFTLTNLRGSAQKQRFRACDKRLKVSHCAYTYKYKAGVNAGLNADIKKIEQAAVCHYIAVAVLEVGACIHQLRP